MRYHPLVAVLLLATGFYGCGTGRMTEQVPLPSEGVVQRNPPQVTLQPSEQPPQEQAPAENQAVSGGTGTTGTSGTASSAAAFALPECAKYLPPAADFYAIINYKGHEGQAVTPKLVGETLGCSIEDVKVLEMADTSWFLSAGGGTPQLAAALQKIATVTPDAACLACTVRQCSGQKGAVCMAGPDSLPCCPGLTCVGGKIGRTKDGKVAYTQGTCGGEVQAPESLEKLCRQVVFGYTYGGAEEQSSLAVLQPGVIERAAYRVAGKGTFVVQSADWTFEEGFPEVLQSKLLSVGPAAVAVAMPKGEKLAARGGLMLPGRLMDFVDLLAPRRLANTEFPLFELADVLPTASWLRSIVGDEVKEVNVWRSTTASSDVLKAELDRARDAVGKPCCKQLSAACAATSECCSRDGVICSSETKSCCIDVGKPCTTDAECCPLGLHKGQCVSGKCCPECG
jgi:hypothetical protein